MKDQVQRQQDGMMARHLQRVIDELKGLQPSVQNEEEIKDVLARTSTSLGVIARDREEPLLDAVSFYLDCTSYVGPEDWNQFLDPPLMKEKVFNRIMEVINRLNQP